MSVTCDWCKREVISFVDPPTMIKISIEDKVTNVWPRTTARVCLVCFMNLYKFIASREAESLRGSRKHWAL